MRERVAGGCGEWEEEEVGGETLHGGTGGEGVRWFVAEEARGRRDNALILFSE